GSQFSQQGSQGAASLNVVNNSSTSSSNTFSGSHHESAGLQRHPPQTVMFKSPASMIHNATNHPV
ncbi:unnamed protein product, partial [Amoebophrya sp. A25]